MTILRLRHMLLVFLAASTPATGVGAQPVVELDAFAPCTTCSLALRPVLQLGDASGDGIIEGDFAGVRYGSQARRFAVFQRGGSQILLFDSAGRFVRRIGRAGQGPGEIAELMDAQFQGRHVVAADYRNSKLLIMDPGGNTIAESRLPVRAGTFRVVSDSTVVLGTMDMDGATARTLHVVRSATGQRLKSFGDVHPAWSAGARVAGDILVGSSPSANAVWVSHPSSFHIEEWHSDGRLVRTIRGDFAWSRAPTRQERDSPPRPLLLDFGSDSEDRLWTLTRVPDARWREARRQGAEGYVLSRDMDGYVDVRIDVFDLRRRRHLGTLTWDEAYVGIVQIGGSLAVQKVTLDTDLTPRVTLHALSIAVMRENLQPFRHATQPAAHAWDPRGPP
jgi:hypothetical protein